MTSRSSGNSSSRNYNRYERNENDNNGGNHHGSNHHDSSSSSSKFCAVCSAAGRPDFNTHYVRADKFDRSSAITCPYLLSIQCRICGANGHTASYCERRSSSSVRLPPISRTAAPTSSSSEHQHQHQRLRAPPRIVFEEHRDRDRDPNPTQQRRQLPPLKLVPRVQNDEPLMRRGPAEASPVHSPEKPRRPRSNNPFALLEPSSSDSESDYYSPVTKQPPSQQSPDSSPKNVGRYRGIEDVKEWPVLPPAAAAHKPSSKPKIVPRVALGGGPVLPLVPPPVFKSNSKSNSKSDKKKNWGDTDSEDDEEFLKRGLEWNNQFD